MVSLRSVEAGAYQDVRGSPVEGRHILIHIGTAKHHLQQGLTSVLLWAMKALLLSCSALSLCAAKI